MKTLNQEHIQLLLDPDDDPIEGRGVCLWALDMDRYIPSAARARTEAVGRAQDGLRRQACHDLAKSILARCVRVAPADLVLRQDAHGRLVLSTDQMRLPDEAVRIDFSLAHCENVLLLGLCRDGRIGVDLEILRAGAKLSATWHYLSPLERNGIEGLPPDDRPAALYKCWTAKEAFVKAVGLGVSFGLEQVETSTSASGRMAITRIKGSAQLACGWTLVHRMIEVADTEAIAAAVFCQESGA